MQRTPSVWLVAVAVTCGFLALASLGCGPTYSALSPGSEMPLLTAQGWTHDVAPKDLSGKVIVVEAFATW